MKVNLYGIFRVQNAPPPKVDGPVRPNTSNMPKAGPELTLLARQHQSKQTVERSG